MAVKPFWSSLQAYRDFSVRLKRTGILLYVQKSPGILLYVQKYPSSFLYVLTWPIFGIAADLSTWIAESFSVIGWQNFADTFIRVSWKCKSILMRFRQVIPEFQCKTSTQTSRILRNGGRTENSRYFFVRRKMAAEDEDGEVSICWQFGLDLRRYGS